MRAVRLRSHSLAVFASLAIAAMVFAGIARSVIRDDGRRLLQTQAAEVGALLTNSFSGVDASLRSLTSVADPSDASARAFVQSAEPLVVGQTRAIILARVKASGVQRVAIVGDGVPEGELTGSRADLMRRAISEPGLVTGVISDGARRRIGLARGPWPDREGWIVYQESAIDPNNPDQPTSGQAFRELDIAMYAAGSPQPDRLVLATTRDLPLQGSTASVTVPVGVDDWLVVVHSPRPLVGSFANFVPWLLLIGGLGAALLAGAVVEVLSRRRDFAVALVDERTAALQSTVDQLESAHAALVRHAFSDGLTGLANRSIFLDRLDNALARAARGAMSSVVMFLDLDRFKWVNDSLGHEVGDQLLVAVAQRLTEIMRPGDTLARLGGDEFVVLCEGPADEVEAWALAERLRRSIAAPYDLAGRDISVTLSIGLAVAQPGDVTTAEELLRDADLAMYRAKELGRDRIETFELSMRGAATARLESEAALRRAIENREFVVYYQPVVSLETSSVVGVEALARWIQADGTVVPPDEFIPLAEDSGLIAALGAQVLVDACAQVVAWNCQRSGLPPLTLSVNLSTRQLAGSELPGLVSSTLAASGLDPALLFLEITESTLMDGETALLAIDDLKALGVTLVVDDFGTGYSSLIYLRRLPVDVLKIDKSFVAGLGDNMEDTAIVTGVIRLAQALGLQTVAEGVETVGQLEQLATLGCESAQGYLWSRPLPAIGFSAWLDQFQAAQLFASGSAPPAVPAIRVLIVDDDCAMRDLLRLTLSLDGSFEIVGEAEDGMQAIELARSERPDVVLLDLQMPVLNGIHALPRILAVSPETRVVVLSALDHGSVSAEELQGSAGWFDKLSALDSLVAELPVLVAAGG